MKLLIVTQKVDQNDPVLGFFHRWIIEFSKHCEKVTVICLQVGKYDLPNNVKVLSLGKELDADKRGTRRGQTRLRFICNFYKYLWQERKNYDSVFVHMNPIYLVLAGWWWRVTGKKTGLWYTHRQVDLKLRVAEFFTDKIFTVAKESFTLSSKKIEIVGHGIPIEIFEKPKDYAKKDDKFRIVSVGRITPIKNLDILIEATVLLRNEIDNLEVCIVGGPTQKSDEGHFVRLKKMVIDKKLTDVVRFVGSVSNDKIREYYWQSDISVNLCPTGGVDKAVLESIVAGLPTFVSNTAFEDYFGQYKEVLLFRERSARDLTDKILNLKQDNHINELIKDLNQKIKGRVELGVLIVKLIKEIK